MRAAAPGNWDLVVSAPWLEAGRLKATSEFVELLSDSIGEESLKRLSRVATVDSRDPALRFILDNLPVEEGELRVKSTDLFGLQIEEAIIFRAQPIRSGQRARRPLVFCILECRWIGSVLPGSGRSRGTGDIRTGRQTLGTSGIWSPHTGRTSHHVWRVDRGPLM